MGAMNSYEVSKSRFIGLSVLIIDLLKGIAPVVLLKLLYPDSFLIIGTSLLFAVLSHCFNPWLKFKGGRGLATAAGGALIIFPYLLLIWIVMWVIFYAMKKDIIFANFTAIIASMLILFTTSEIAVKYTFPQAESNAALIIYTSAVLIIILIKHFDPFIELINSNNIFNRKK